MPSIEIDDDIYDYLVRNTRRIGEGASTILRRLLGIPEPHQLNGAASVGSASLDSSHPEHSRSGLEGFVRTLQFQNHRNATDRFLALLGFMHEDRPEAFDRVLQVSGRCRNYFGQSESEITHSGQSTHPRRIPGTKYWVLTNADTDQKQKIFRRAASVLGYPSDEIDVAIRAIE